MIPLDLQLLQIKKPATLGELRCETPCSTASVRVVSTLCAFTSGRHDGRAVNLQTFKGRDVGRPKGRYRKYGLVSELSKPQTSSTLGKNGIEQSHWPFETSGQRLAA